MTGMNSEWKARGAFAEVAETLGITTTEIFSALPFENGDVSVIYTPGVTEENLADVTTYLVLLSRDEDGILRKAREPVEVPDFLDKITDGIEDYMRRQREHGNG